jgi:hypothetical protein
MTDSPRARNHPGQLAARIRAAAARYAPPYFITIYGGRRVWSHCMALCYYSSTL